MRRLIRFLGLVLVLVVAAQAVLWYSASRWFSQLADRMAPVVQLDYGTSYAWLTGAAGIRGVRARPLTLAGEEIAVGDIGIRVGGPIELFSLFLGRGDRLPDDAALSIRQLRLTSGFERQLREQSSRLGYLAPFEALGCNARGRFSSTDYADLGWHTSTADIDVRLRNDEWLGQRVDVGYDMQPLGRLELELVLDGPASGSAGVGPGNWKIKQGLARFHDRGMMARRNNHCARGNDIDADTFHARHMDAVREELESYGLFADEPVLATYAAFARDGGNLALAIAPSANIDFADYRHYRPEDQLRMLNASLRLNDGETVPVTARFHGAAVASSNDVPEAEPAVRVQVQAAEADEIELSELPELAGRRVSISTLEGVTYMGTLLGVEGPLIRIENERGLGRQRVVLSNTSVVAVRLLD